MSVHVDGLAASAASVIAMAGDEVCVSPLSVIMIHNPAMFIAGETSDLEVGMNLLSEVGSFGGVPAFLANSLTP